MKKKESPFIKVRRNLFNSNELSSLMAEEGATGAGTYILIACYLAQCEEAKGSMRLLNEIAAKAHKSVGYVRHIVKDYDLFVVDGDTFTCRMVTKSMHIETELSGKSDATELPSDDNAVATDLQPSSISSHRSYVRTGGRINRDRDRNRNNTSTPSVVEAEPTAEAAAAFSHFVDIIFDDAEWTAVLKERRGIDLNDREVMNIVKQEFIETCIANGKQPGIDGFDIAEARRYCYRWLNNSHENRRQLDRKIREQQRSLLPAGKRVSDYDEKLGYGYLIDGCRYSLYGDIVPLNAPPCRDRNQKWNPQTKKWE